MTITLSWWLLPLVLFLAPFIHAHFAINSSYASGIEEFAILVLCWGIAVGILVGHFL